MRGGHQARIVLAAAALDARFGAALLPPPGYASKGLNRVAARGLLLCIAPGTHRGRIATLAAAALAAGALAAAPAEAKVVVKNERQFQQAVKRLQGGGTIVLRAGRYRLLRVGPRSSRLLVVRAKKGASVRQILLRDTRNVRIENVILSPDGRGASIKVERSRKVELRGVHVRGTTVRRARVLRPGSTGVTIRASRFRRCGDGAACVLLGRSANVQVLDSRFEDCLGCDFIRGPVSDGLVLRGNRFLRSLVGPCGSDPAVCNHNDLVQLQGGSNIVVERNVFGVYQPPGAGQLYLAGPIKGIVVRDNLFRGSDPALPGLPVPPNGIVLGNRRDTGNPHDVLPTGVTIAHNTILSGRPRGFGTHPDLANSLAVSPRYALLPEAERPVVVNNVLALTGSSEHLCGAARTAANVTIGGTVCSDEDAGGDPVLTSAGIPGIASVLVIDRGVPGFSTVDQLGRPRDPAPDIGAYEYVPEP